MKVAIYTDEQVLLLIDTDDYVQVIANIAEKAKEYTTVKAMVVSDNATIANLAVVNGNLEEK